MKNYDYEVIKSLMNKDGYLDELIYDFQCEHKRDTTIEEEENMILEMVRECKEKCLELSCSLTEAYKDIME